MSARPVVRSIPLRRRRRARQLSSVLSPWIARARRVEHAAGGVPAAAPAVLAGIAYRLVLLACTAALLAVLLHLQETFGAAPPGPPPPWREHLRWLEVLWLAPLPLALALWLGWLGWGETARGVPHPITIPRAPEGEPVRLVFRFCARGQNVEVLRESVAAVRRAFDDYDAPAARYRIEVVSERAVALDADVPVYVVPPAYAPPHGARYKARALAYLQSITQPEPAEWHIYLDEESCVDVHTLAGIYGFIARALRRAARRHLPSPRMVGQGAILYEGGNPFFRGADALRTGDDLGRFRLQYALGAPVFGAHGSYLVVRGVEEPALSFDVGPANSITEDAAWALRAWARGWRFGWVRGYVHEQPPQRARDFIRQRARWITGIRQVVRDRTIPRRFRAVLLGFVILWHLSVLPLGIAAAALLTHTQPFTWARLPADFAWTAFVLAYLHGLDTQARHRLRPRRNAAAARSRPAALIGMVGRALLSALRYVAECLLALGVFWYALLEVAGVLYSLKPQEGFYVIDKPRVRAELAQELPHLLGQAKKESEKAKEAVS